MTYIDKELLRERILSTRKNIKKFQDTEKSLFIQVIKMLKDEQSKEKRKEIIDYVFADKLDDNLENFLREDFLK